MRVKVMRAIIRIDLEKYIPGLMEHQGYIDGSAVCREPSEEREKDVYDTVGEAEAGIDKTALLEITDDEAVIEYEHIPGEETVYFNEVEFRGVTYPMDVDLYSPACYEAILAYFNR